MTAHSAFNPHYPWKIIMSEIEGIEQVYKNVLIQLVEGICEKGKNSYWTNCIFPDGKVISTHSSKSIDGAIIKARLIIDHHFKLNS